MSKRLIAFSLVLILMLVLFPSGGVAAGVVEDPTIILFDDGSYVEVFVGESSARAANTVSGFKKYIYRDSDGTARWEAELNATFAYSGGWYTCTTANCDVTIYDSSWYVISNSTIRSSNNAVTSLTMGLRSAGVTIARPEYTIKLTCDSNGNLS
jgi:hypothetical protein